MGKVSPVSIKYNIKAKFVAEGVVEKPDVIGAVFGQTEGLLGEDLELRELQKNGKIGRIDVTLEAVDSKTSGEINIPTSLDKTETTMIAATLETIERIGPCDAKIQIDKIEDVRGNKREFVIERAKKLLAEIHGGQDTREMQSQITESARKAKIVEYGTEMLPAGPDIDISEELIVVEGRADVLNLLNYGIKNVIAMNGASLPKTIKELSEKKIITLFIDGDRGGLLEAKDALATAKIAFIAQAPSGSEVEELSGKDIIQVLRNKVPAEEFEKAIKKEARLKEKPKFEGRSSSRARMPRREEREKKAPIEEDIEKKELSEKEMEKLQEILQDLTGTKGACLLDKNLDVIKRVPSSEVLSVLYRTPHYILVMDGTATNSIVKEAERSGCQYLVARNFAVTIQTRINLMSL